MKKTLIVLMLLCWSVIITACSGIKPIKKEKQETDIDIDYLTAYYWECTCGDYSKYEFRKDGTYLEYGWDGNIYGEGEYSLEDNILTFYSEWGDIYFIYTDNGISKELEEIEDGEYIFWNSDAVEHGRIEYLENTFEKVSEKKQSKKRETDIHKITPKQTEKNMEISWQEFLKTAGYKKYISDYKKENLEYVIADLNDDNKDELMIKTTYQYEPYFATTWIFTIVGNKIVPVYENGIYGYGTYEYSIKYNAIVGPSEFKPFNGNACFRFYKLKDSKLEELFVVGEDEGCSYFKDKQGKKNITADERKAYFEKMISFEWKAL